MSEQRQVWAVADIHGARTRLLELLREEAIVDSENHWIAGTKTGICLGDYLNRGEEGAAAIALVRQLQTEATVTGGQVIALLGNHDALMCGVLAERQRQPYGDFANRWLLNGGRFLDLEALEADVAAQDWLRDRPAMALIDDTLYIHSDSTAYCELGSSIDAVNAAVRDILHSGALDRIAVLFDQLSRRHELRDAAELQHLQLMFGGKRVVHGHSPFFGTAPIVSHNGRCINIEGGLWESEVDEPLGFIYWAE